jgi:hypothetical protein
MRDCTYRLATLFRVYPWRILEVTAIDLMNIRKSGKASTKKIARLAERARTFPGFIQDGNMMAPIRPLEGWFRVSRDRNRLKED